MLMVVVVMIVMTLVRIITVLLVTSWGRQWWCWWYWTLWLSLRQAGCINAEIRMKDIWLYDYMQIYWCVCIEDCGCHWGKLPARALRSAWRKAQLLIWIVLPRAANSTFDNHHGRHHRHDCHQHHYCRYDKIPTMIMLARMWCSHIDVSCQSKSKNGNIRKAAIDSWRGPAQVHRM